MRPSSKIKAVLPIADEDLDKEIVEFLESPAKMEVDPEAFKVEVNKLKNKPELKSTGKGESTQEDKPTPAAMTATSPTATLSTTVTMSTTSAMAAMETTSTPSLSLFPSGMVSGAAKGTGEPLEKGGLAVNRARRQCTLNPPTLPLRSRSLSTTSNRRLVKGSDRAMSSSEDSMKPLVAPKQKLKCQKKVSDFFPKN